jgi:ATP-dependent RNA helicase DeaD
MENDIVIETQQEIGFASFNLPEEILKSLMFMGFDKPTPIQEQTIPLAIDGKDVLGSAQTGTGKTAAFSIPAIVHVMNNPKSNVLVLTPTRELATQVLEHIKKLLGRQTKINTALLIGGDSMDKQFRQLKGHPRIIVGTPGRVNDHLDRGTLHLANTDFLVLDETDRMLDMGFVVQLEEIFPKLAKKRQTLMFSATMSSQITRMAGDYLNEPLRISIGSTSKPTEMISQESIQTTDPEKYGLLVTQLEKVDGAFVVFVKTKRDTEKLVDRLRGEGHEADAIHGDLRQSRRDRVIQRFRGKKCRILVATDVAARGLDIPHIECVVNYDLPHSPEDYIHRIGRTGRAGSTGLALSFITGQDRVRWRNICKLMDPSYKDDPKQYKQDSSESRGRGGFGKKRGFGGGRSDSDRGGFGGGRDRSDRGGFGRGNSERGTFAEKRAFSGDSDRSAPKDGFEKRAFSSDSERGSFEKRSSFGDSERRAPREGFEKRSFGGSDRGGFGKGNSERGGFGRGNSEGSSFSRGNTERKSFGRSDSDRSAPREGFEKRASFGESRNSLANERSAPKTDRFFKSEGRPEGRNEGFGKKNDSRGRFDQPKRSSFDKKDSSRQRFSK